MCHRVIWKPSLFSWNKSLRSPHLSSGLFLIGSWQLEEIYSILKTFHVKLMELNWTSHWEIKFDNSYLLKYLNDRAPTISINFVKFHLFQQKFEKCELSNQLLTVRGSKEFCWSYKKNFLWNSRLENIGALRFPKQIVQNSPKWAKWRIWDNFQCF